MSLADQQVRERAQAALDRAAEVLAQPRAQGEPWRLAEPGPIRPTPEPVAQRVAPAAAVTSKWVRDVVAKAIDAMCEGTARALAGQTRLLRLRIVEAERRIAELEAQIAELKR